MKEMVGGCCVCSDDRGWAENPLVYCDGQGCTVAVHQACYGIVTVPPGNWYCRKCESPERSARAGQRQQHCELCPSKDGAIKRTDNNGWAHVVCALYIPEVRFGNVTTMEPILLQHIPPERFHKVCYICEEGGKGTKSTVGACMQCNKSGCKQQFHVTCAQALGLLCEEAGNYLDNVKYCGYCQHHYSKLKKGANVKTVPPYRPVTTDSPPSPDKDAGDSWSKPPGKRKLSTSGKGSTVPIGSKPGGSGKTSGTTSPAPLVAELAPAAAVVEDPLLSPTVSAPLPPATTSDSSPDTAAVNGKFTTSNFVESVVTPSASVFGDSGKSGKKRKSQAKDEGPAPALTIVNPASAAISAIEEKRLKIDPSATPVKIETPAPSVVVKVPSTTPSTSPPTISPVTRQPATTPPIAATSSIVVSVPLAVASLPTTTVAVAPPVPISTPPVEEVPTKRGRSQSTDKGRKQKRGGSTVSKRGGRNSEATPSPVQIQAPPTPPIITTATITPVMMPMSQVIKESPPSSPESKQKTRKQIGLGLHSREDKDKLFQNGVSAPHMLGNQLNPASTMAQKMSDTLNQELEAHSIFSAEPNLSTQPGQLVGPQLHSRVIASVRGSGAGTPQSSTPPASAGWGPNNTATPQTLDQLLERQWEQGSQFLMEQAQHFDIASLLTCLHQLRAENLRLEEHVSSLLQRRDHLLAVNARLAIPLVPPVTVNNIHPAAANVAGQMDSNRNVAVTQPSRVNNTYPSGVENGPTSPGQPYHPAQNTIRSSSQAGINHPPAAYASMYSVSQQSQQIVMRRDVPDMHHQNPPSKSS